MNDFDIGQVVQEWTENHKAIHGRMSDNLRIGLIPSVVRLLSKVDIESHIVSHSAPQFICTLESVMHF
jgi:hypothetical protein